MQLSDFDFDLPEDLIALRPAKPRSASRQLVYRNGVIEDDRFSNLARNLRAGDLLVFNNTKVLPARLFGARIRADVSARVEVLLLEEHHGIWQAMARPAKKLRVGDRLVFDGLEAVVTSDPSAGIVGLEFKEHGATFWDRLDLAGQMPLPPYIANKRKTDAADRDDYQTVFGKHPGAVAAPTASLHFDAPVFKALEAAGIDKVELTLHVGAGTFLPVKEDVFSSHKLHSEWGEITAEAARKISAVKAGGGRVIPVGTTALRLLETVAGADGRLEAFRGDTDIFIAPGYKFRVADGLITNFHLPKSTLIMLVAALIGLKDTRRVYDHAIAHGYRFYSYGDSSLLLP